MDKIERLKPINRLDEQTISYYRRVQESLNEGFENDDEKELFVSNVISQLKEDGIVKTSENKVVSLVIEHLLNLSSGNQIQAVLESLTQNLGSVCCHPCASHVLQNCIEKTLNLRKHSNWARIEELLSKICTFVQQNLQKLVCDTYGSHIVRVLLSCCAGVSLGCLQQFVKDTKMMMNEIQLSEHSDKLELYLGKIAEELITFDLQALAINRLTSPVIQISVACLALSKSDHLEVIIKKLLILFSNKNQPDSLPLIVGHEIGSHLAQVIVKFAPVKSFKLLYKNHLQQCLAQLAVHPRGNFVLSSLIQHTPTEKMFGEIVETLLPCIENIMAFNHVSVILSLAIACTKYESQQGLLLKSLQKAFHCRKPKERQNCFLPLIASLYTYEVYNEQMSGQIKKVHLHGSLLLQQMFKFSHCAKLVKSLLAMSEDEQFFLSSDPSGSHVIEAFLKSETVGKIKKEFFLQKSKNFYTKLACNKNGSRTFDTIWSVAPLPSKASIAKELLENEARLSSDRYGRFVLLKYGIDQFRKRPADWTQFQQREKKKQKLLGDIVNETGT